MLVLSVWCIRIYVQNMLVHKLCWCAHPILQLATMVLVFGQSCLGHFMSGWVRKVLGLLLLVITHVDVQYIVGLHVSTTLTAGINTSEQIKSTPAWTPLVTATAL